LKHKARSAELDAALGCLARIDRAVAGELVPLGWGTVVFDRGALVGYQPCARGP
jgi:hypothetical protein